MLQNISISTVSADSQLMYEMNNVVPQASPTIGICRSGRFSHESHQEPCQSVKPIARPHVKLKAVVPDRIRPKADGHHRAMSDLDAAIPVLWKVELHARYRTLHPIAQRQQCRREFNQTDNGTRPGMPLGPAAPKRSIAEQHISTQPFDTLRPACRRSNHA
jgi:hypothetical protein